MDLARRQAYPRPIEVHRSTWDVAVSRGALTIRTADRRVRLRLPEDDDLVGVLQAAQALACEWAMDETEEGILPELVVVRRARGATVSVTMLCAVVAVGLRQALAVDGIGDRVLVQAPAAPQPRERRGSVRASAAARPLG